MKSHGLTPPLVAATLFLILGAASGQSQEPRMSPDPARGARRDADLLKRYDKNGDGKLDDDERADAKEAMLREQMERQATAASATPGGKDAFQARMIELFDKNKDGRLDDEERADAQKYAVERGFGPDGLLQEELFRRFDRNRNGKIDDDERPAMQEFIRQRVAGGQSPMAREAEEKAALERILRHAVEADPAQRHRFDRNQNGRIDDDEWRSARQEIQRALSGEVERGMASEMDETRLKAVAADLERRRQMSLDAATGNVASQPKSEEEKRRLEAVSAEVARRRQLRSESEKKPVEKK